MPSHALLVRRQYLPKPPTFGPKHFWTQQREAPVPQQSYSKGGKYGYQAQLHIMCENDS